MSCARKQFRIMQCKKLLHFLLLLENESEITIRKTSQFKALFALTIFLALTTSISISIITSNDDDDHHDVDNILVRRHAKNKRKCLNF